MLKSHNISIRLTESAVFLRTDDSAGSTPDSRSSLLRGLLILELAKPTKVTSIELKLEATTSTVWPEGYGARRAGVTEQNKVFSVSTTLFNPSTPARRTASVGPGSVYEYFDDSRGASEDERINLPRARSRGAISELESASSQRNSADLSGNEFFDIPPYSLHAPQTHTLASSADWPTESPVHSPGHLETVDEYPGLQTREENIRSPPHTPHVHSSASSIRSFIGDRSLSRNVSIEDAYDTPPSTAHHSPQLSITPLPGDGSTRSLSESRGRRKSSRFSLTSVSNVLLDAVRSSSPQISRSREEESDISVDDSARGRTRVKVEVISSSESPPAGKRPVGSKERLVQALGAKWRAEPEEHIIEGDRWKTFKPGTYTYPISFTIPGNAPPTLQTAYGSVSWKLTATVHRLGPFTSKLEAMRDVIIVSCPTEEDTEDTENIIVERHWDAHMHYLITVSGRSFYIGGTVPISMTIMPLNKVKIHRLIVSLEEKTEYLSNFKRIGRTDFRNQVQLLAVRHTDKEGGPILPLESDDAEAFRKSPLHALVRPEDDLSEMASSLMGPGPWTFQQDLKLPSSCDALHFTNRNKKSNVLVTHTLKFTIRAENGDPTCLDPRTGKNKLFDIVVQTPVNILSCRCNPEWTNLPHYTKSFEDPASVAHQCPCRWDGPSPRALAAPLPLEHTLTYQSFDSDHSGTSAVEGNALPVTRSLQHDDSVAGRTHLYERLVSGREGITGEAPPAYVSVHP